MRFRELKEEDFEIIKKVYRDSNTRNEAQDILSEKYNVRKRTIRRWAKEIGVGVMKKNIINPLRVMVYDIETSRIPALVWWTGKQYVNHTQLLDEARIITICWKWLNEEDVHQLRWDENQSDEAMLKEFGKEYVKADMVIGQNNDRFDNRWVNARLAKFGIRTNNYVRSLDIMKECKRMFRLPSYSMAYMCKYFGVEQKLEHEGVKMWDKIQSGTPEEQKEYLDKMVEYNVGDIISTEALYYRLRPYFGHKMHLGVMNSSEKFTSPLTGKPNVELFKTTVTPAGTIQRIMLCKDTDTQYKISNKQYMNFLDYKMKRG